MLIILFFCGLLFVFTQSEEFQCNAPAECHLECIRSHKYLLRKVEELRGTIESQNVTTASMESILMDLITQQASSIAELASTNAELEERLDSLLTQQTHVQAMLDIQAETLAGQTEAISGLEARLEETVYGTYSWELHPYSTTTGNVVSCFFDEDFQYGPGYASCSTCVKLERELEEYFTALIVIDSSVDMGHTMVGIATSNQNPSHFCGQSSEGWAINEQSRMWHNGALSHPSTSHESGDKVTVRIDWSTNTISWAIERDNVDLGVVLEYVQSGGIPAVVYPAVRVACYVGNVITLLEMDGIVFD